MRSWKTSEIVEVKNLVGNLGKEAVVVQWGMKAKLRDNVDLNYPSKKKCILHLITAISP